MNRLRALSAGTRAETGRFSGVVHSVFARACNVSLDDGRLLALIAAEYGNAPHAVRVQVPGAFAFDRAVRAGERAGCRAGVLRIGTGAIEVRLEDVPRWRARLDDASADLARAEVRSAWRTARRCLHRHNATGWADPADAIDHRVTALYRAAHRLDHPGAVTAIGHLVGVGAGLTPAGDDILVGFLAGLHAGRGASPARERFVNRVNASVRDAARFTNRISAEYLLQAADGAWSEPLYDLARAIVHGHPTDAVEHAAAAALAVGASSGGAGARGLLTALAAFGCGECPGGNDS